jgi:hypothetical protein
MAQAVLVRDEGTVLAEAGRELAQRQPGVADEQGQDAGDDAGNQDRVGLAEEIGAFEKRATV